jgi:DNA-binding NarL/FixJ family response regulator
MSSTRIRILLLYMCPLLRGGIRVALEEHDDLAVFIDGCEQDEPAADVVVADYECGLERLTAPSRRDGRIAPKVLILTHRDGEADVRQAIEAGALGYLPVGCQLDELVESVRALYRGMRRFGEVATQRLAEGIMHDALSERESEVLRLLAQGAANKTIAKALQIAVGTVKSHVKHILVKLDASSRTEAVSVATRRGLLRRADGRGIAKVRALPSPQASTDGRSNAHAARRAEALTSLSS